MKLSGYYSRPITPVGNTTGTGLSARSPVAGKPYGYYTCPIIQVSSPTGTGVSPLLAPLPKLSGYSSKLTTLVSNATRKKPNPLPIPSLLPRVDREESTRTTNNELIALRVLLL